ncbi:MAG: hypothetical protein V1773_13320 [bacterium]
MSTRYFLAEHYLWNIFSGQIKDLFNPAFEVESNRIDIFNHLSQ